jgi:hypothetical protein
MFVVVTVFALLLVYRDKVQWVRQRREALAVSRTYGTLWKEEKAPAMLWLLGEPSYSSIRVHPGRPMDSSEINAERNRIQRLFPEAREVKILQDD